jgi:hypothetical protein
VSPVLRALATLVTCLLLALSSVHAVFSVVLPPARPPAMPEREAATPRLSKHLLLLVVDGLRLDIARDQKLMPFFSAAMERHRSAELWAGRVSMTTSAILSLGTGQRGSFEQMVRNLNPEPPPYDSWLKQARKAGRTLLLVGDPAWHEMYGENFADRRLDPEGVSIDVDFNPQTFRDTRAMRDRAPDALVAHFVTPDHQGHAHGIQSEPYRRHIHGFDRQLRDLLGEFGPDWTVVVLGDHGAADSGTHGSDVAIQRSTVILAYGPGIAPPGPSPAARVDQADLAGTLAALLGVPAPAHARGHPLTDWLDLPDEARGRLACDDARRAQDHGRALGLALPEEIGALVAAGCAGDTRAARAAVERIDQEMERSQGFASPKKLPLLLLCSALVLLAVALGIGPGALAAGPWGLAVGALSVLLSWGVERLAEPWPLGVRVACFAAGNLLALAVLLRPSQVGSWLERWRGPGVALIPGVLIVTYTGNVQPEAWVALAVGTALVVLGGGLHPGAVGARGWLRSPPLGWAPVFGGALLLAALFPAVRSVGVYPAALLEHRPLLLGVSVVAWILAGLVLGARHAPGRWGLILGGTGIAVASFLARPHAGPLLGRGGVVLLGVAALVAAARRERGAAVLLGLAAYGWLSRDFEPIAVAATVLLADLLGAALDRWRARGVSVATLPQQALLAAVGFGLLFLQRVAIQGALDIDGMDWGCAAFGDVSVSMPVVGVAIGLKYALAAWLAMAVFSARLGPEVSAALWRGAVALWSVRAVVLLATLLFAGTSFWTGLRTLGDLPFALLYAACSALGWLWVEIVHARRLPEPVPGLVGG